MAIPTTNIHMTDMKDEFSAPGTANSDLRLSSYRTSNVNTPATGIVKFNDFAGQVSSYDIIAGSSVSSTGTSIGYISTGTGSITQNNTYKGATIDRLVFFDNSFGSDSIILILGGGPFTQGFVSELEIIRVANPSINFTLLGSSATFVSAANTWRWTGTGNNMSNNVTYEIRIS